ncbi:MAG: hypothetical protein GY847_34365, partial [Proteobacteria bacterium]|nr:hypothetical protein [Pseudomonadota bacterium]
MNSNYRAFLCLTLILVAMLSVTAPVSARSTNELSQMEFKAFDPAPINANTSVRADTVFLFASSGPGSFGSAGTSDRGFNFDDGMGGPATAGWNTLDVTAQDGL